MDTLLGGRQRDPKPFPLARFVEMTSKGTVCQFYKILPYAILDSLLIFSIVLLNLSEISLFRSVIMESRLSASTFPK